MDTITLWFIQGLPSFKAFTKLDAEIVARQFFDTETIDARYARIYFREYVHADRVLAYIQ